MFSFIPFQKNPDGKMFPFLTWSELLFNKNTFLTYKKSKLNFKKNHPFCGFRLSYECVKRE